MLPLPKAPKVIEKQGNTAIFEIEALYPGYGVTVGNALRRVLYSSLSGTAITQVKVKGAQHEFATLPGVLEDMLSVCLNLKQVRLKMHTDEPRVGKISVSGAKKVTAKDITFSSDVDVVSNDVHIATITDKKAKFEAEVRVEKGLGYKQVKVGKKGKDAERLEIGQIPLDAFFTPVRRVRYTVENMRVGERTDFDKLILEVETDGSMTPEEAFQQACEFVIDHFTLFGESFKKAAPKPARSAGGKAEKKDAKKAKTAAGGATKLEDLNIATKTANVLQDNGVKTVAGLVKKKEAALLELPGLGQKAVDEIKKALKKEGKELAG